MIERWYRPLEFCKTRTGVDDYGGVVELPDAAGWQAFRGYIGMPTSAQQFVAAQRNMTLDRRLYCDVVDMVEPFGLVRDPAEPGRTYRVLSEANDAGDRGHHLEFDLESIVGGV